MISILLPFYNAGTTLPACLASICSQTCTAFEVLAIDDHSTDTSADIIRSWPDFRVRLLMNPGHGIVDALNHGLTEANYPVVARMDADDLMRRQRLEKQLAMLRHQPDLALIGCRVSLFPDHLVQTGYREYVRWQNDQLNNRQITNQRFVESPLAHPSAMFRKQAIMDAGGYRDGAFPEDYELWLRLIERGADIAKHPDVLLDWRESGERLSRTSERYAREAFDKLRAQYLSRLSVLAQRPVAFWGAGRKTRRRADHLIHQGVRPWRWIDIDPRKIGNRIDGVMVEPDMVLKNRDGVKPFVLNYVTNHGARDLIAETLEDYGYQEGEDFLSVG